MKNTTYLQRIIFTILILANMTFATISQAQGMARPLTAGFLFEFAQKLFGRGEVDEAQTVLKKLLKSDPENSSVQRFLKSIDDQKNTKAAVVSKGSRPSDIASDIIFIQKNVMQLERRNRDLEFAIRKILQENTFLFQTLSQRNHELLELRKKFFGYDGNVPREVNAGSMQKTAEILNTYQDQITERDRAFLKRSQEISRIMKDVGDAKELLTDSKETSQKMDSAINALEWKNDLTEKRSYLVEKALILYEKNKDLTALHTELSAVSKSLKEANENYGDTVEEYETKIQKLNNVWVQDKARQQSEIDRLKDQIRDEKVKMLAAKLAPVNNEPKKVVQEKSSVEVPKKKISDDKPKKDIAGTQDNAQKAKEEKAALAKNIKSMKADIKQEKLDSQSKQTKEKVSEVADAETKVDPQLEIKRLQEELAKKEKELSDRSRMFDAKIRNLKDGWAKDKTDQQSMAIGKSSNPIDVENEDAVKASDVYKDVVQQLDYLKDQLSMKEEELHKFQGDMVSNTTQLEELQNKLSQRDSRLADMDALIVVKDQQILALKRELVAKVTVINQQNKVIEELKAQAAASQAGLKDLGRRVVAVKPAGGAQGKPVEELRALVAELEDRIAPDATSKNSFEDLKQQLAGSLEALQQKDRDIQELKAQLDDDKKLSASSGGNKNMDARVRKYEEVIDGLKNRLATAVSERKDAQKNWEEANKKLSALVDDLKKSKSSGDASAQQINELTQKIADLSSQMEEQAATFDLQLQTLRDKIAQRNAEIADLKNKLAEKEKQVSQFYESMEKATSKLSSHLSIRHDQQPTAPVLSSPKDNKEPAPVKEKDQKDWNPADNDVYALQQRLNTLGKELKYTQDELASRTQETGDLHNRLKEKEAESSRQAKGASETKDIVKLEKELALIKQQSDLTKTTIKLQEASLAKSQKEAISKEKSLKSVVGQLEKLKKQTGDYKSTIKEKDEQITLQRKALDHEIQKNETLKRKLQDINQMIGMEQESETGKNKSTADLKSTLKTYEIRERDYKRQINEIQDQLKSSYVMIEDGESRITTLKQRLEAREERVAALEEELSQRKGVQTQVDDPKAVGQEK